jgi:hypothetical protein
LEGNENHAAILFLLCKKIIVLDIRGWLVIYAYMINIKDEAGSLFSASNG